MSALPVFLELQDWKVVVDDRLSALLPPRRFGNDAVRDAMREGLLGPGKRIRPLMTIGVSIGFGQSPLALLDAACALEMIHAASLFLDDLPCMDDATERRGRPALHIQFGEDIALLASVALLSQAFRVVGAANGLAPALRAELVTLLADTVGASGLVQGQYRDLRASDAIGVSHQSLSEVNELKTGALFRAALLVPALAAKADAPTVQALGRCANDIGHAFQLRDDLEDHASNGPTSLVTLLGRAAVGDLLKAHVDSAASTLGRLFPNDRALGELLCLLAPPAR